jgi:hypothetical protein
VVRRWHPDTRLNGHAFTEARLEPGDRLSVGPLEFDVLESLLASEGSEVREATPAEPETGEVDGAESRCQLDALEALEAELDARQQALAEERRRWDVQRENAEAELRAQRETLKAQAAELETRRESLEEERQQHESDRPKAEAELRVQREELKAQTAELEAQRQSLEEERRRHESDRSKAEAELRVQREELKAQAAELASQRGSLEEERRRHESDRSNAEAELRARREELKAQAAELESQRGSLEEERRRHESDRPNAEAELHAQREELKARAAELESRRESLEEERRRNESDRSNAEAELRAQREELKVQAAELESQRGSLEEERRRHESDRPNAEAELHAQREELKARAAELEGRQRAIEERQRRWEAECADAEKRLQTQQDELATLRQSLEADGQQRATECDEREKELASQREELEAYQAELEAARQALEEQRHQWEVERDEAVAVDRESADQRTEDEEPTGKAPLSSLEILRRMGSMPVFPEDDEPQESEKPAARGRAGMGLSPRENPPHAAHEGDEESIDDYMARLLQRVRGAADEGEGAAESSRRSARAAKPVPPPRETIPIESDTEASGPRPTLAKRREPVEMSPRAVAPEKHVDLTAMREVANFSAQNAIDWHSRRVQGRVVVAKAMIMFLGLLAGAILLYVWHRVPNRLTFSAAMASLVVATFWGCQYFVLVARRFGRRRRFVEQSQPDDEASEAQPLEAEILLTVPPASEPTETEEV